MAVIVPIIAPMTVDVTAVTVWAAVLATVDVMHRPETMAVTHSPETMTVDVMHSPEMMTADAIT